MSFSNTFDTTNTGSGVSNREDLTDVLTILAPEETPILSSANKERATATNVEWTVDSLAAPLTCKKLSILLVLLRSLRLKPKLSAN